MALLAGHFGGLTPTKLIVRSAAFVVPTSLSPSSFARNSAPGCLLAPGASWKTSSLPCTATLASGTGLPPRLRNMPGQLAVLLGDLEPVDAIGVLAGAGQVPATEEALILRRGGGQQDVDEECGGDDGDKAHERGCYSVARSNQPGSSNTILGDGVGGGRETEGTEVTGSTRRNGDERRRTEKTAELGNQRF